TGISDPGFLENSRQLNSAIDDIEATVAGSKIPRTIRPYFGWPILGLPLLGIATLIILSVILIRTRGTMSSERKVHAQEIETIKTHYSRQLHELEHSAQLQAARSALAHFTPPPPELRRNNIEVAGKFR